MVTPISKHDIIKQKHCTLRSDNKKKIIMIKEDLDNDIIDYWHKKFQLTINDENILLNPLRWLNDQHMATMMQMLYVKKTTTIRIQTTHIRNHENHT